MVTIVMVTMVTYHSCHSYYATMVTYHSNHTLQVLIAEISMLIGKNVCDELFKVVYSEIGDYKKTMEQIKNNVTAVSYEISVNFLIFLNNFTNIF